MCFLNITPSHNIFDLINPCYYMPRWFPASLNNILQEQRINLQFAQENEKTGGWENDETVKEAAIREAIEEAGVRGDIVHFLGHYLFKSKTLQDEFSPEGLCRAAMFALLVKEELECWPEQSLRRRSWLTVPEAIQSCRHPWMRQALEEGFLKWHDSGMTSTMNWED